MSSHFIVEKSTLKGSIRIPPSKSHSMRALLFAFMAKGKSVIHHYLDSPDVEAMVRACRIFGAEVEVFSDKIEIQGVAGQPHAATDVVDSGNSGQVFRFMGAMAALSPSYTVITGDESIRENRPVQPLLDGLKGLGAFAVSTRENSRAPIVIKGPLKSGTTRMCGKDSQPVSALLMAAAFASGRTEIFVDDPGELPWISLTLSWLDRFGIAYQNNDFRHYIVEGGATIEAFEMTVPGDFSSAAFPLAAGVLTNSELELQNLDMNDAQGDKRILTVLQEIGANISVNEEVQTVTVKKSPQLKGLTIDVNDMIDAVPILSVIACTAKGETRLVNARIARAKECDRLSCMAVELRKMGADIEEREDALIIKPAKLYGAKIQTYHDHRMVMAMSVAGMIAEGKTHVSGVEVARKSYPTFLESFQELGANISLST
ncbi:MAG: 3-phosphoshikimate 1-carboxyvinyltransferase [Chlamydiales bacterium]|jgi:3-phosphoshikimate 1-carboxyvinyltransferase